MQTQTPYIIVCDTETGGLPPKDGQAFDQCALIEIAVVVIDTVQLKIIEEKDWLIKPYKDKLTYSDGAQKIHGITPKLLQEKGLDAKLVYKEYKDILTKYKKGRWKPILAGHNFQDFDIPFLSNMFEFFQDDLSKYIRAVEDTQRWASYKWVESINYKLITCCDNLGIELVNAHRAVADTRSNAEMMIKFLQSLRNESVQVGSPLKRKFKLDIKYPEF